MTRVWAIRDALLRRGLELLVLLLSRLIVRVVLCLLGLLVLLLQMTAHMVLVLLLLLVLLLQMTAHVLLVLLLLVQKRGVT